MKHYADMYKLKIATENDGIDYYVSSDSVKIGEYKQMKEYYSNVIEFYKE